MAHFAQIDDQGIVTRVLVIEQDEIDTGAWGDPASWVQTSYNTRAGVYYTPNANPMIPDPDQSKAFRKNYAADGFIYDALRDAFIPPRPFPSWVLNEDDCLWYAPVPSPAADENTPYAWDEDSQSWITPSN